MNPPDALLEMPCGGQTSPRVRIPPSPLFDKHVQQLIVFSLPAGEK